MYNLLYEIALKLLSSDLPSASKWDTLSPHLSKQSLLLFTHKILYRLIHRVYVIGPDNPNSDNGWAVTANRKRRAVLEFLENLPNACTTYGIS